MLMLMLSSNSNLAVASSTVAVAGVFRPLHGRVRHSVDRRYNRTDGDAEAQCFAAAAAPGPTWRLVTAQLRTVIRDTLQPNTVHLWIRPLTRGHLPCHGKILVNGCRSARCCS